MDKIESADIASKNRDAIIKHRDEIQFRFLVLGGLLQDCRDKLYWQRLGYESFAAFLGDPDITLKRSTAYNLINIYHKYSEGMGLPTERLAKIGSRRLQIILPVVETDPDKWLGAAESMSKSDLINEVRAEKGKEPVVFKAESIQIDAGTYIGMVKSSPCCVCGREPVDPAHFPISRGAGAADNDVIPLCRECHDEQHRDGVDTFHAKYKGRIWAWVYDKLHARY